MNPRSVRLSTLPVLAAAFCAGVSLLVGVKQALAAGPTVLNPTYTLSVLTKLKPPVGATQPDDLSVSADGKGLWIGYGNGVDTFGKGGPSTLVEYDIVSGTILQ